MSDDGSTSKAARIGLEILGWLLLAAGVAALILPGPGLLLLALGLWVLAKNYRWADRLLDPVKRAAYRGDAKRGNPRAACGGVTCTDGKCTKSRRGLRKRKRCRGTGRCIAGDLG